MVVGVFSSMVGGVCELEPRPDPLLRDFDLRFASGALTCWELERGIM